MLTAIAPKKQDGRSLGPQFNALVCYIHQEKRKVYYNSDEVQKSPFNYLN